MTLLMTSLYADDVDVAWVTNCAILLLVGLVGLTLLYLSIVSTHRGDRLFLLSLYSMTLFCLVSPDVLDILALAGALFFINRYSETTKQFAIIVTCWPLGLLAVGTSVTGVGIELGFIQRAAEVVL